MKNYLVSFKHYYSETETTFIVHAFSPEVAELVGMSLFVKPSMVEGLREMIADKEIKVSTKLIK
jgi:hypothetical protein